jgi:hypothetical protein
MKHTESKSQQAVMHWWRAAHRGLGVADERYLMAFPLQGARTPQNGARLKAEGMRAGTPDMFLALKRGVYPGLWVELKRLTGKLTESQKDMARILSAGGFVCICCHSTDEAIRAIEAYLRLKDGEALS